MTHGNASTTGKMAVKQTQSKLKKASRSPLMEALTRYGYVARGVLFLVIGLIALQVGTGSGKPLTDQHGALAAIAGQPFGRILLIVMVVGLAAYALWGFIRAIFDPLNRGNSERGMAERLGFVISGLSYGSLVYPFLQLLVGQGSGAAKSQTQATQDVTAQILAQPFGPWLIAFIGLATIGWSAAQLWLAYTAGFERDFKMSKMNASEREWTRRIGQIGIGARALIFALIGVFFIQAAVQVDPQKAIGLDGALLKIIQQPEGPTLLAAAAVGLMAFGLYSMLCARWLDVS